MCTRKFYKNHSLRTPNFAPDKTSTLKITWVRGDTEVSEQIASEFKR